jgi:hypothetical protein
MNDSREGKKSPSKSKSFPFNSKAKGWSWSLEVVRTETDFFPSKAS